jgi:hypothetical protein
MFRDVTNELSTGYPIGRQKVPMLFLTNHLSNRRITRAFFQFGSLLYYCYDITVMYMQFSNAGHDISTIGLEQFEISAPQGRSSFSIIEGSVRIVSHKSVESFPASFFLPRFEGELMKQTKVNMCSQMLTQRGSFGRERVQSLSETG